MSATSRSLQVYAGCLFFIGMTLLFIPNVLLIFVGFPPTEEPHIRLPTMGFLRTDTDKTACST